MPDLRDRLTGGAPIFPIAVLFGLDVTDELDLHSLFFEQRFGYGPVGRGTILTLGGIGLIVGIVVGAILAQRAVTRGEVRRLGYIVGISISTVAFTQSLMTVVPGKARFSWRSSSNAAMIGTGRYVRTGGDQVHRARSHQATGPARSVIYRRLTGPVKCPGSC
jgi:hypothetical protein